MCFLSNRKSVLDFSVSIESFTTWHGDLNESITISSLALVKISKQVERGIIFHNLENHTEEHLLNWIG